MMSPLLPLPGVGATTPAGRETPAPPAPEGMSFLSVLSAALAPRPEVEEGGDAATSTAEVPTAPGDETGDVEAGSPHGHEGTGGSVHATAAKNVVEGTEEASLHGADGAEGTGPGTLEKNAVEGTQAGVTGPEAIPTGSDASEPAPATGNVPEAADARDGREGSPSLNAVTAPVDVSHAPESADATTAVAATNDVRAAAGVFTTDRDGERLHPELRTRLDRVARRMKREYGHTVEVVEGYRSQERQDHLYAQGRSRPGAVVTWTRSSLHTEGRAADLRIDGGWDDRTAYARLQRIAREEGLSTLGMRDPGHVQWTGEAELDGSASRTAGTTSMLADRPAAPPRALARAARVAAVADVARVARTAAPARPGAPALRGVTAAEGTASQRTASEIPAPPAPVPAPELDGAAVETPTRVARLDHAAQAGGMTPPSAASTSSGAVQNAGPVGAPGGLDRVMAVEALQQTSTFGGSSVSLRGLGDGIDLVRVGLLNRRVSADMDINDPDAVRRMRGRVGELHQALEASGFDPGRLAINAATAGDGALADAWLGPRTDTSAEALKALLTGSLGREDEQQPRRDTAGQDRRDADTNDHERAGHDARRDSERR